MALLDDVNGDVTGDVRNDGHRGGAASATCCANNARPEVLVLPPAPGAQRCQRIPPFARLLERALDDPAAGLLAALVATDPRDETDLLLALTVVHDLWLVAPGRLRGRARHQGSAWLVEVKGRLERAFVDTLPEPDPAIVRDAIDHTTGSARAAESALRRIAAEHSSLTMHDRLADLATLEEVERFLAADAASQRPEEDLIALALVGTALLPVAFPVASAPDKTSRHRARGSDRIESSVGTALSVDAVPSVEALRRRAIEGYLATNRFRQPELIGAIAFGRLVAPPRARRVVRGMRRTGVARSRIAAYERRGVDEQRLGHEWLDRVVAPLAEQEPWSVTAFVRGALWRAQAEHDLLAGVLAPRAAEGG